MFIDLMIIKTSLLSATRSMSRNKIRSALTTLGVVIGILSVITLYGIGSSAKIEIRKKVFTFGVNSIYIGSWYQYFTDRDIERLQEIIPQIKYITPMVANDAGMIVYLNNHIQSRVWGVNNDYLKMNDWPIESGSYFSDENIISYDRVAIIGERIRYELFQKFNPLGKTILIDKTPFTVIGCLKEKGTSISGRDFDNVAIIPYTTLNIRLKGRRDFNVINAAVESENEIDETVHMLMKYFKSNYNLELSESFIISTSKDQLRNAEEILKNITILVIITATISLIVGGIGIMNIMLVSVSERTREIGIRMAIGAKSRDIMIQFLAESLLLSSLGGLIGIIFGLIINLIIVFIIEWIFVFSFVSILISFFFTTAVGIIFGFYPAWKASKLNPIDALRYE